MRSIGTLLVSWVVLWEITPCLASGWNDYELDIGDGYQIVRCNSLEIILARKEKGILIMPGPNDAVGPIAGYAVTDKSIFTRNHGKKPCDESAGGVSQDVDTSKEFYFILSKKDDNVTGPLSKSEFMSHPAVASVPSVNWKTPRNPDILFPLAVSLLFLIAAVPILTIKYYWIAVPLIIIFLCLVETMRKRLARQQSKR